LVESLGKRQTGEGLGGNRTGTQDSNPTLIRLHQLEYVFPEIVEAGSAFRRGWGVVSGGTAPHRVGEVYIGNGVQLGGQNNPMQQLASWSYQDFPW